MILDRQEGAVSRSDRPAKVEVVRPVETKGSFYDGFPWERKNYFYRENFSQICGAGGAGTIVQIHQEVVPPGKVLDLTSCFFRLLIPANGFGQQVILAPDEHLFNFIRCYILISGSPPSDQAVTFAANNQPIGTRFLNRNFLMFGGSLQTHIYAFENQVVSVELIHLQALPAHLVGVNARFGAELSGLWLASAEYDEMRSRLK